MSAPEDDYLYRAMMDDGVIAEQAAPEVLRVKHVSFFNVQINDDIDERVTFFNAGYEAGYAKAKFFQK
jgi:hypothetical protein